MEIKHRTQLVELLKHFNLPLRGIEVGVAEGLNATDLMQHGLKDLYCVDRWETIDGQYGDGGFEQGWHDKNFKETTERLAPYKNHVHILRGYSKAMAFHIDNESVGLVYLDGDHSREGVRSDLQLYWDKLVEGGIMAGHDYLNMNYGVNAAVKEFAAMRRLEIHLIPEHKEEDASFWMQKI